MKKEKIIKIVNDVKSNLDTDIFAGENNTDNSRIGCNQFRELASICRRAECFEELELLVKYNESKAKPGESWNKKMKNGKTLAACIIDGMNSIRSESSDSECLENLRLYVGYFYWNARIYAAENQNSKPVNNGGNKGYNSGNYQKNNNGRNNFNGRR